jgi:hypothetical protein
VKKAREFAGLRAKLQRIINMGRKGKPSEKPKIPPKPDPGFEFNTRPERLDHTFADKHKLDGVVQRAGGREEAMRQILDGLKGHVPSQGRFGNGDQRVRRKCDGSRIRGQRRHDQDWYGVHPMKDQTSWRPISSEEAAVIRSILSQADIRRSGPLIADLDGALVANETTWILDVKVSNNDEGADLPNGPFPAQAFVPNSAEYQGEVIIWITDGHVSGLEYAWVSDDPPTRWPRPDEMEVVLQASS